VSRVPKISGILWAVSRHTTLEQIEHGHHIFRAYWKNGFLKQYEKFSTFLRNELCSNNTRVQYSRRSRITCGVKRSAAALQSLGTVHG